MATALLGAILLVTLQVPGFVRPADPTLDPRCAGALADTFDLVIVTPGQPDRALATLHRTRSPSRENGVPVCVIVQHYQRPGSSDLDSSVVHAVTLAPLRYAAQVGTERHRFRFSADSVVGTVERPDSAPRIIAQQAPGAFFLSVADLEVVRSLPLRVGFEAQFDSYNPPRGFHPTRVRVEALDTVETAGRRETAWRIAYDAGAAPTVMWLAQSGHELIRSRSVLRNGAIFWRRRPGDL